MVYVDQFKLGTVNRVTHEYSLPGGKGVNVSMVLKNLGMESCALGFIAGYTGYEIQRLLTEQGVNNEFIYVENGLSRINVKLKSDEETEINGQGPDISESHVSQLYMKLDKLSHDDYLILAGSIPESLPLTMYGDIAKHLEGKGTKILVDATRELLMNVLPYHPFLIKPNVHELGEVFDVTIKGKNEAIKYARLLRAEGARNVLVSMAGDGAILVAEDENIYQADAPSGNLVNSVGAGDSMIAGFIYAYEQTGDYAEAFHYAICTGSASAFSETLASKESADLLMKEYLLRT